MHRATVVLLIIVATLTGVMAGTGEPMLAHEAALYWLMACTMLAVLATGHLWWPRDHRPVHRVQDVPSDQELSGKVHEAGPTDAPRWQRRLRGERERAGLLRGVSAPPSLEQQQSSTLIEEQWHLPALDLRKALSGTVALEGGDTWLYRDGPPRKPLRHVPGTSEVREMDRRLSQVRTSTSELLDHYAATDLEQAGCQVDELRTMDGAQVVAVVSCPPAVELALWQQASARARHDSRAAREAEWSLRRKMPPPGPPNQVHR
jgi:hypothetical protein